MIDSDSRYASVGTMTLEMPDGRRVLYLRRRMLPDAESIASTRTLQVLAERERLDLIAYRTIGDALQFWRICDANDTLNPFDVAEEHGGSLRIPSGPA